ncbi:MAG: hypothetical protein IPJ34_25385 [Myxococcales bacterium]|nr:hypothetical protein [Myxococcales bacterium]
MAAPESLEQELSQLSASERAWAERQLALRAEAAELATRLQLDAGDVFHILRHLERSPAERLAIGLRHGRLLDAAHPR